MTTQGRTSPRRLSRKRIKKTRGHLKDRSGDDPDDNYDEDPDDNHDDEDDDPDDDDDNDQHRCSGLIKHGSPPDKKSFNKQAHSRMQVPLINM